MDAKKIEVAKGQRGNQRLKIKDQKAKLESKIQN